MMVLTKVQTKEVDAAIRGTVARLEKRKAQADDAVQATWERLLEGALDDYDATRGTLLAFAAQVARSTVLNMWKREGRCAAREMSDWGFQYDGTDKGKAEVDAGPEAHPDYAAQVRRHFAALEAAIAGLTSDEAALFEMMTGGASYEEAAEALGCKVGTVKVRWHRLKETLAEEVVEA